MSEVHPIPANPRFKDLTGREFGLLKVESFAGFKHHGSLWLCRCRCGVLTKPVSSNHLRHGDTQSCGCHRVDMSIKNATTHGKCKSPEYKAWCRMITRCENKNERQYKDWGGRGITICQRWRDSFPAFLEDMGPMPSPRHELDRRDNDGNYEPGNCRWATNTEQSRNTRRNVMLTCRGETKALVAWEEDSPVTYTTITLRLQRGWTVEDAIFKPSKTHKKATAT